MAAEGRIPAGNNKKKEMSFTVDKKATGFRLLFDVIICRPLENNPAAAALAMGRPEMVIVDIPGD